MNERFKTAADFKAHIRSLMRGSNPSPVTTGIEPWLLYNPDNLTPVERMCLRDKNSGLTPSERAGERDRLARAYAVCERALASLPDSEFLPKEVA